jgi:hypothetical protein
MKKNYVYVKASIPGDGYSWTPHVEFDVDSAIAKKFLDTLKVVAKNMIGYEDCDYDSLEDVVRGISGAIEAIKELEEYEKKNEDAEVQVEEDDI